MRKTIPGRHRGHPSHHDSVLCRMQPKADQPCGYHGKHRNGRVVVGTNESLIGPVLRAVPGGA